MTKKDALALLSPSLILMLFAIMTLIGIRHLGAVNQDDPEKFARFAQKVQSRERQLTPDQTLEFMRLSHSIANRQSDMHRNTLSSFARMAAVGLFGQICIVYLVWKRAEKK